MSELFVTLQLLTGAVFLLLDAVGILRMPDLYSRIQAAAKASTLGVGCIVLALAVHFSDLGITIRSLLVVAFLFLTVPVAGHIIGRAAYFVNVPLWKGTWVDELRPHFETQKKAHRQRQDS